MGNTFRELEKVLRSHSNPEKIPLFQRFFKTGPGEYAEGDQFLGLTVPLQRKIARDFRDLPLPELEKALHSPLHELRLTALIIVTHQFDKAMRAQDLSTAKTLVEFYLANTEHINNWDLVDVSAPRIIGHWLFLQPASARKILYRLARSKLLWEKRIAILSTLYFIKQKDYADTLAIAEILITDQHDLIHKAIGWMLREAGKMDQATLDNFLAKHAHKLPRTALRYAIERYPEAVRKKYLSTKASQ